MGLALVVAACGGGGGGARLDAAADGAPPADAPADATGDAAIDAAIDAAVDAAVDAAPSNATWPKTFDSTGTDRGFAAAVDEVGNVYFALTFSGPSIDLLGGPLSLSPRSGALVSYTAAGAHRWSVAVTVPMQRLAVGNGSLYVVATVTPPQGSAEADFVLSRFTASDGALQWSQTFTGAGRQEATAIAADAAGNVYVAGLFDTIVDFGGGDTHANAGSTDAFLASFAPDQTRRWSAVVSHVDAASFRGVAADAAGNTYATGSFTGTLAFASDILVDSGLGDIFVVSYDATGAPRWARDFGASANERGERIAVRGGRVCETGLQGANATFLATYVHCMSDTGGSPQWSTTIASGTSPNNPEAIAIDGDGRVHVVGRSSTGGNQDGFVNTHDAAGAFVAGRGFIGAADDIPFGAAGSARGAFVTGAFSGPIDFGDGVRTPQAASDVFFMLWNP